MKKGMLIAILFCLLSLGSNAQIYNTIKYYDKFDDVLKTEKRKALITKTDTTIIVEEKGKEPRVYYILNKVPEGTIGSKEQSVNLAGNVFGYEETWCVIPYDKLKEYNLVYANLMVDALQKDIPSEYIKNTVGIFWLFAVHRTITTRYSNTYVEDLFWIQDDNISHRLGKDVSRIIYKNER